MSVVRALALWLGVVGALVFGAGFVASLVAPGRVEQVGKDAIRAQVEQRVNEKIDALDAGFALRMAERLHAEQAARIRNAQDQLRRNLPARIAAVVGEMADLDCPCRQKIENWLEDGLREDIASTERMQERLTRLIRAQYMDTAAQLQREWRIFTGANALVFGLLAAAVLIRRRATWHLLPATALLVLAAAVTAYFYLFQQNWLHTIVFNDYVGWGYFGYLGAAFAMTCDVAFNRARVTAQIVSHMLEMIGSSLSVLSC